MSAATEGEKQKVPILRFPEFEEEWATSRLGDFFYEKASFPEEPLPLYSLTIEQGITPKTKRYERTHLVLAKDSAYKRIQWGDFAFNPMNLRYGALAKSCVRDDVMVSKYYNIFACHDLELAPFFEHYLTSYIMIQFYNKMATGSLEEKKRVHYLDFIEFQRYLPHSEEQKKIATFLTAVDDRIKRFNKKKVLLETYRKGVMQKLFSQAIRFRKDDGTPFPNWEEKQLGETARKIKRKNTDNAVTAVLTNSATKGVIDQRDYFDKDIANQDNLGGYYVVEIDDFVYNPRISATAPVGPINRNRLKQGVMSPLYNVFGFSEGNLDFLEYYFQTSLWHRYMTSVANIGARHDRMNITGADFNALPLPMPHPDEQKKIADFLSAIDDKITTIGNQLQQTRAFKKGLLQQMFV